MTAITGVIIGDGPIFLGLLIAIIAAASIGAAVHRRRAARKLSAKVRKAIKDITADGVVEGPKGPYVSHRRFKTSKPRSNTRAPGGCGPYGLPWQ